MSSNINSSNKLLKENGNLGVYIVHRTYRYNERHKGLNSLLAHRKVLKFLKNCQQNH